MDNRLSGARPKTYCLQETMENGLNAILARLDRADDCRPFFELRILPKPLLGHAIWDNGDMTARYLDAFTLAGQATGRRHPAEEAALRRRLEACDPYENPFMATRMLITRVDEYLREPSEACKRRLEALIGTIRAHMTFEEDYAYYFRQPEGWNTMRDAEFGTFTPYPTYPVGGILLALARYLEAEASPAAEDLMVRLVRFVADISGTFAPDGRFYGHTHSGGILTAAAGLARWAAHTGDCALLARMKAAFDWTVGHSSGWGWVPDGLGQANGSSETCSITDAIHLGLLLARSGCPEYYETVERYARNQLIENQFRRTAASDGAFGLSGRPEIAAALYGSWASWSLPNSLDNALEMVEGCCLGSGIRGCFLAWDNTITKERDVVSVNMAFSRNSPWVEVVSYQPYAGRMDLLVHDAPRLRVRVPSWAGVKDISVAVNGAAVRTDVYKKHYLEFTGLGKGDVVSVTYPLRIAETSETVNGKEYAVRWRGDTVTGISPTGAICPIYERSWMETGKVPMTASQPYADQTGGPVHW